ncbi:MAG TPA: DUF1360 domain-containing protein, partial [Thermoleophilaceae bacterium]|nr:DUF1360 domain-containing protein [Thermoleophilaceae bacterium]
MIENGAPAAPADQNVVQLEAAPEDSYSAGDAKPLAGYATLTTAFAGAVTASEVLRRRRGGPLPKRIGPGDLALLAVATYKLSRLATKARVTSFARAPFTRYTGEAGPSEVSEEPRGTGL